MPSRTFFSGLCLIQPGKNQRFQSEGAHADEIFYTSVLALVSKRPALLSDHRAGFPLGLRRRLAQFRRRRRADRHLARLGARDAISLWQVFRRRSIRSAQRVDLWHIALFAFAD